MLKAYRYKLEPNKQQRYALARTLDVCRELYNDCLQQRKWNHCSRFEQQAELPALKAAFPIYNNVYAQVLQSVLDRLNKTFNNFFRSGFGFPRYKGKNRYDSFCYPQAGFALHGRTLQLSKIGNIKVRLSRELPADAVVKTCTIKRSVNGWFATLVFEYAPAPLPASDLAVGIDVGIENFAALSDGTMIQNPRFYECGQAELRVAQRRVSRRTNKRSSRRRKAVVLLQKVHARIANRRMDFLHKQTTYLVRKFGTIVVENLNVKGLAQGILSKQVRDASWSTFFSFLTYKAEEAGRKVIGVDCKYTSQTCPSCGTIKKKSLSEREHKCLECGYTTHRDTAAAEVILARMEPLNAKIGESIPCLV